MAQGTPVVTSADTAMSEFAVGALVDPADTRAIADTLDTLLADEPRRAELSVRAQAKAATMTWEAAAATTLAAYRTLLG
jgi:glycosyltransferase involved in cell wall biosynthesis